MIGRVVFLLSVMAFGAGGVAGCSTPTDEGPAVSGVHYQMARYEDLVGWRADDHAAALATFLRSCERLDGYPADRVHGPPAVAVTAGRWQVLCAEARRVSAGDADEARLFFERRFSPVAVLEDGESEGLFTGYFEPELRGAPTRQGRYRVPLYRRPVDSSLARHERAQIDAGVLADRNLELLWVDDPVDAFFLQIQGSGRVALPHGEVVRVGYAGNNGHSYFAIGRALIDRGEIAREDISMQSIQAWLRRNPAEAPRVMELNRSYVFFRVIDGDGPIGALGVPLTPQRSLAVDPAFVPLGGPVWVDLADPLDPNASLRRLVIAQDTGGAVKGAIRGDVFWGYGADAALRAGVMKSPGRYYLLIPRDDERAFLLTYGRRSPLTDNPRAP